MSVRGPALWPQWSTHLIYLWSGDDDHVSQSLHTKYTRTSPFLMIIIISLNQYYDYILNMWCSMKASSASYGMICVMWFRSVLVSNAEIGKRREIHIVLVLRFQMYVRKYATGERTAHLPLLNNEDVSVESYKSTRYRTCLDFYYYEAKT